MADERHSIQTYVSDMLSLERHVAAPFATQAQDDEFRYGAAASLVQRVKSLSDGHVQALEECLERLGGHAASPSKEAVAQVAGMVAGAIDKMRKTKVSKALRDDYTALALCTAGYTMLQTTALALSNEEVADLAQRHLEDYARCVMEIGEALPEIVVEELRDIGLSVDPSMAEPARRAAEEAWRAGAQSSRYTTGMSRAS
ncbi:MAG: DUF892 family protein, partial [Candidatus Eremiobacteraeota bacterium]|nr:DUF892 family protein [Candidatus Eremiobacteraeota bacterium]MBV9263691.1 DUF892 family protein [Candidatus Eremiobacteraeota bacterium]